MLRLFQSTRINSCVSSSIPLTIKRSFAGLLSFTLANFVRFALAHPKLKALALTWVYRYPALESWLYRFSVARGLINGGVIVQTYSDLSMLTPSALTVYTDLKAAIEKHKTGR
jgi:hypothetical protein